MEARTIRRAVILLSLVSMLWVPAAAGDHVEHVEPVEDRYLVVEVHADETDALRLADDVVCDVVSPFCQEPRYRSQATVSVWEETNGCDGLQERKIDCDGDGTYDDPDTRLFGEGCASGGTDPCGRTALL